MDHYINLFKEQLGTDDMHSSPFLDAAHKLLERVAGADGWKPIESYDKLKKKPKHAVFYFEATTPARGQHSQNGLPPHIELRRNFGSRVCILWLELPDPAKPTAG